SKNCKRNTLLGLVISLTALSIYAARRSEATVEMAQSADYSRFSHSSPREHADLMDRKNCGSCHRRNGTSPTPAFPVHKDCTQCHLVQFTSANRGADVNPICTICHTKEALNASNSATKGFPGLRSFRAEYDHAQHLQGKDSAKPAAGCPACHTPT